MATASQSAIVKRPVLELIQASKAQFEGRLPEGMTAERFMFGLATAVQKTAALASCDPKTVILAAYEAAELGINLSPSLQLGYIIPYGNSAQFQISYRGLLQKAYETGCLSSFYAEVVYEHDLFSREYAPKRMLHHMPPQAPDRVGRGEPIGAYALVEFKDGHFDWEYLTKEQIDRHRKASKMTNSLMWTTFWEEGWRKTVIRALAKRLPMTHEGMEKLAEVIEKDAATDTEQIIPGNIEMEPESPLLNTNGNGHHEQTQEAQAVTREPEGRIPASTSTIFFHVGKMLTQLTGACARLSLGDYKNLGGRRDEAIKGWTMPASLTEDFLKLCESKKIPVCELDDQGRQMNPVFMAQDEDLPQGMFDDHA